MPYCPSKTSDAAGEGNTSATVFTVALIRGLAAVSKLKGDNEDQNHGIQIAKRAMEAPRREIVANAGEEPSVVLNR